MSSRPADDSAYDAAKQSAIKTTELETINAANIATVCTTVISTIITAI
jgi:hypothetical protein